MTKKAKKSNYEVINEKLLSNLDKHNIPWRRPWSKQAGLFPRNYTSKKLYRGSNFISLLSEEHYMPYYVTFAQAKNLGLRIKKGEKSYPIHFYKTLTIADKDNEDKERKIPMLRGYNVFNVSQLEELPKNLEQFMSEDKERIQNLDISDFISKIGPKIKTASQKAYFNYSEDFINMPKLSTFKSEAHYLDTLFHELVHWSGHRSRLNRDMIGKMGSEVYSKEELVAEIGSAYLCAVFGIDNNDLLENSKSYIKHWSMKIRQDKTLYYQACSQAQKAVDYLLELGGISLDDGKENKEIK